MKLIDFENITAVQLFFIFLGGVGIYYLGKGIADIFINYLYDRTFDSPESLYEEETRLKEKDH